MDNIEFNKSFFVRNDDYIFKLALMASRYGVSKHVQENLFFAGKSGLYNNFSYLMFTELFNEINEYSIRWIKELDSVTDEFDWNLHRSKLSTKIGLMKTIDDNIYRNISNLFNQDKNAETEMQNIIIIWNNLIAIKNKASYKEEKKVVWDLWDILKKYRDKDLNNIAITEESKILLNKLIKYRNQDDFYKKHNLILDDKDKKEVIKIEKDIERISFKEDLAKEVTNFNKFKKIFKI